MSEREDPLCYDCGGACAGGSQGIWCCVCAKKQPEPDPVPEMTVFEAALEAARANVRKST